MLMGMSEEHPPTCRSTTHSVRLLRAVFDAYYQNRQELGTVFDTNRAWCSRLTGLARLFPRSRMICCVRDVGWIVDSFERLAQSQPFRLSALFGYDPEDSVSMHADLLTAPRGVVGYALDGLRQAFYGDHADRLLLLRYDTLAQRPAQAMEQVYAFLQLPAFAHDYAGVQAEAERFDAALQMPGLHRVRRGCITYHVAACCRRRCSISCRSWPSGKARLRMERCWYEQARAVQHRWTARRASAAAGR